MTKEQILSEIRRTARANGGVPLGWKRFKTETGIGYWDWFGKFGGGWGDLVREAGFEGNRFRTDGYPDDELLQALVGLTRRLNRVPVRSDLVFAKRQDEDFPSEKVFRRLGTKPQIASRIVDYCRSNAGHVDVLTLWEQAIGAQEPADAEDSPDSSNPTKGYVYLLRHGARAEYKIGRTYTPLRREGEVRIELPEKLTPIHYIETAGWRG